jgi:hypothetical protein
MVLNMWDVTGMFLMVPPRVIMIPDRIDTIDIHGNTCNSHVQVYHSGWSRLCGMLISNGRKVPQMLPVKQQAAFSGSQMTKQWF